MWCLNQFNAVIFGVCVCGDIYCEVDDDAIFFYRNKLCCIIFMLSL